MLVVPWKILKSMRHGKPETFLFLAMSPFGVGWVTVLFFTLLILPVLHSLGVFYFLHRDKCDGSYSFCCIVACRFCSCFSSWSEFHDLISKEGKYYTLKMKITMNSVAEPWTSKCSEIWTLWQRWAINILGRSYHSGYLLCNLSLAIVALSINYDLWCPFIY